MNLDDKNIAIVTHRSLMPCIPGEDLKKYLLEKRCRRLIYITHPLLLLEESKSLTSSYEYFKKNKLVKSKKSFHLTLPESLSYFKDLLYTFFWVLNSNQTFDLYFGINNINALVGLILKKIGRVKKVVYYTIDLYPQRFPNKIINWLYHRVDSICVKYADETWNVSPYLSEFRTKHKSSQISPNQFTVPIGIWFNEVKRMAVNKTNYNKIVYVGHLKDFYGVELIIRSAPLILKKIPKLEIEIIGGGEQLGLLKTLVKKLKISPNVTFHGWQDKKISEEIMSNGAVGLAPFNSLLLNQSRYKSVADLIRNGDPAKIKDYLSLGLPVVMTSASITSTLISEARAALIIDYTPKSLSGAVITLLTNKKLHSEYRKNALKYIQEFDWNIIFEKNITRLIES